MNSYCTYRTFHYCRNVVFSDNVMETGTDGKYAFQALSLMDRFHFENNVIINNSTKQEAVYISYETYEYDTNEYAGTGTRSMTILGNNLQNGGMYLENCMQLQVHGNKIRHNGKLFSTGINIRITEKPSFFDMPPAAPVDVYTSYGNFSITDNEITNAGRAGIIIKSSNKDWKFGLLHIDHNTIAGEQMAQGIQLEAPNGSSPSEYWDKAMIGTGNILSSGVPNAPLVNVFGSWLKAANPLEEQWIANGNPNSLVTAPQGAIAIDKTIAADNTYLKNTLSGSEGWGLVSERNKQVLLEDRFSYSGSGGQPLDSHTPDIDLFGSGWVTRPGSGSVKITVQNGISEARANLANALSLATVSTVNNGELKGVFRSAESSANIAPCIGGLIFRAHFVGLNYFYWRFYIRWLSTSTYEAVLETVGSLTPISLTKSITLGSGLCYTLKVHLNDEFISVFYNDLQLWNLKNNYNIADSNHGLVFLATPASAFCARNFKHLI